LRSEPVGKHILTYSENKTSAMKLCEVNIDIDRTTREEYIRVKNF